MRKVQKHSQKWVNDFLNSYHYNLPNIINTFTEFYGEEYRDFISSKLVNLNFHFIINDIARIDTLQGYSRSVDKMYEKYYALVNRIILHYQKQGFNDYYLSRKMIDMLTFEKLRHRSYLYDVFIDTIAGQSIALTFYNIDNNQVEVLLPISFLNHNILFHELNHVITTPIDGKLFFSEEVCELINELASQDIARDYIQKGSLIIPRDSKIDSYYLYKVYLVKEFYEKFKPLIKECLIKQDVTLLYERLGSTNLTTYFKLVSKLYYQNKVSEEDLKRLKFLVVLMQANLEKNYILKLKK